MPSSIRITDRYKQIFRVLLFSGGLALLAAISTFAWFKADPISFRQVVFEPVRDGLFFYRELQPFTGWRHLRRPPTFSSRRIELPAAQSGDPNLIADLWEPQGGQELQPALLLLHGSSRRGRRHGFVRMLASEFQGLGWIVLTPDARGFGESETPRVIQHPESWRTDGDIGRCLAFLHNHQAVDKQRIFVLGHSMGGASALEGALDSPQVQALVLIGPTRYLSGARASFWQRVRFSADRDLSEVISEQVMVEHIQSRDIARFAREGRLRAASKPILLLDGGMESEAERRFLQEVSRYLSANSEYHTVPGVGHYCGVYHVPGTDFILWRQDFLKACIAPALDFLGSMLQSDYSAIASDGIYFN